LIANRYSRRRLLLAAALLMAVTGVGFAVMTDFWPLLVIAFIGTMNPTSGDASIFGPLEQTVLTQTVEPRRRTALFARYSVIGSLAGALGVLAASFPDLAAVWTGWTRATSMQFMFALYAGLGVVAMLLYRPLSQAVEMASEVPAAPLQRSRRLVYGLAALFGMASFGTGFLVQSLVALWLYQSFQISVTTAAAILFWSGVCSAISYLVAVPIAKRIGLINTMVFTHLPSNVFLILIPFAPDLATAVALLLARSALSQMDVPTRASYVMAVVAPEERPAAASITAVPKTFA
jgi:predicted MFS family arabinose efflux permease